MQLVKVLCWLFFAVFVDPTKVDQGKVFAWLEEDECEALPGTSLLQVSDHALTSTRRGLGENSDSIASSETPLMTESSQERMTAVALASVLPPLAEQLLFAPDAGKESLAGALVQSERDQLEEKMRSRRMLSQLRTKSAELQEQVEELRRALQDRERERDNASQSILMPTGNRVDDNSGSVAGTASATAPKLQQQPTGTTAALPSEASTAKVPLASWRQSALSMLSSNRHARFPPSLGIFNHSSVRVSIVLLSAIFGICACVIGSFSGWFATESEGDEPRKTPRWLLNYVFLVLTPCVFLVSSLVWVQDFGNSIMQDFSYLALVMVLMLLQCILAAGPIAEGLVHACLGLPQVVVNAFLSLEKDLGNKFTKLLVDILGETPIDSVVAAVVQILTSVISPVLQTCAAILDVSNFLPRAFFDVSMLIPFLGIGLFVLFVQVWAIVANLLMLKIGLVTIAVACLMCLLLIAALASHRIVQGFVYTLQAILNFSMRTIMVTLIPTEALDPALKWLGPDVPSATDLKMQIVELLELHLNLEDPSDEDNIFDQFGAAFDDIVHHKTSCC